MAVSRCFFSIIALTIITDSNACLDDHDRTIIDEDKSNYDDILDAIYKGKHYRNHGDIYDQEYGIFRARDDDSDGIEKKYDSQDDGYPVESGLFIDKYDSYDDDNSYSHDDDFDVKNGISNSDVGVYNMYRSRGRGTPSKIDKEKLRAIITLLHQYNPVMKLFTIKGNRNKRVAWKKWIGWYDLSNSGINGIG